MDGSIMNIADAPWPGLTPDLLSVFRGGDPSQGSVLITRRCSKAVCFFVDN